MKVRCCNCSHVFQGSSKCPKCNSNALEALRPIEPKKEAAPEGGPRYLTEVPQGRDNLTG